MIEVRSRFSESQGKGFLFSRVEISDLKEADSFYAPHPVLVDIRRRAMKEGARKSFILRLPDAISHRQLSRSEILNIRMNRKRKRLTKQSYSSHREKI